MLRLNDKEILALDEKEEPSYYRGACDGAKAQLKKFSEWGNEDCNEQHHAAHTPKHQCPQCISSMWQSLLEENDDCKA